MDMLPSKQRQPVIKYNDLNTRVILALISAQLVVSYNEIQSPFELLSLKSYYIGMACSFIMAMLLIEWIYRINLMIYQNWYSRRNQLFARVLLFTIFAPILLLFLMDTRYYVYYHINIAERSSLKDYLMLVTFLIVLLNYHYYLCFTDSISHVVIPPSQKLDDKLIFYSLGPIENQHAETQIAAPAIAIIQAPQEIVLFKSINGVNFSVNEKGEKAVWNHSLTNTIVHLDVEAYFKISRRHIVKRDNILSVEKTSSQRLKLELKMPAGRIVTVSEHNTPKFKVWFGKS